MINETKYNLVPITRKSKQDTDRRQNSGVGLAKTDGRGLKNLLCHIEETELIK